MNTFFKLIGLTLAASFALLSSAEEVALSWSDNSDNETGFEVQRSLDGEPFEMIGETPENVSTYNDPTLSPGQLAIYRVRAFNHFGSSGFSNELTIPVVADKYYQPFEAGETPGGLNGHQVGNLTIRANTVTVIQNED